MSETVHTKGKLIPTNKTPEAYSKTHLGEDSVMPSYFDTHEEWVVDVFCESVAVINGLVYEIESEEVGECEIFTSTKNDDGSISFEVKYYNGGCGFNEAIDEALKDKS